jgi:hypothetical protein
VHWGYQIHRVTELPRLKAQLAVAVQHFDKAVEAQMPSRAEVGAVRDQLQGALKALG